MVASAGSLGKGSGALQQVHLEVALFTADSILALDIACMLGEMVYHVKVMTLRHKLDELNMAYGTYCYGIS